MDYDDALDTRGSYTPDSVQWQGSQTACAALDLLLSEAAYQPRPEVFRTRNSDTIHPTSSFSTPLSSRLVAKASGSSTTSVTGTSSSRSSTPNGFIATPSSQNPLDYRNRQSRSSTSARADPLPVGDPDEFLSMLRGISQRIDGNIRSDTSTPRDTLKRKPPSKRTIRGSRSGVKRVKPDISLVSSTSSTSESKVLDLGIPCSPTKTPPPPKPNNGLPRSCKAQMGAITVNAMDVDSPQLSRETMPPPPAPLPKAKSTLTVVDKMGFNQPRPPLSFTTFSPQSTSENIGAVSTPPPLLCDSKGNTSSARSFPSTPVPTPKLHPLLDVERKHRRLKLQRTISASLASLPAESSSTSKPSRQQQHQTRQQSQPYPGALPHSQGSATGSTSRNPHLGVRRTHTFPSTSQKMVVSSPEPITEFSTRRRAFKPPLLSSSQPPSTFPPRSAVPLLGSSSSSNASPNETPNSKALLKLGDESMDDLPPSSDGDVSFGDAISLDVDMDALEQTLRKYD